MGWLYPYHTKTRADLVKGLRAEYNTPTHKILRSQCAGNRFWALCEGTRSDGQVIRYILLCLLQGPERNDPGGSWGYKDMDESVGPYYYDCPLSYLDLATEPLNETAAVWRAKVRMYWEQRKQLSKPCAGMIVTVGGTEYRLIRRLHRRGWTAALAAGGEFDAYRIKLTTLRASMLRGEYRMPEPVPPMSDAELETALG